MKVIIRAFLVVGTLWSCEVWSLVVPPRSNQNHVTTDIIISPSVAKANLLNLEQDMRRAHMPGNWWHLSIQDGRMVPKISFGSPFVAACRKAFPETILDVKLGVIEPEHRISDFVKAGADILSVHPESTLQLAAVIHKIQESGVAPGVVLNPATPITSVEHVLNDCRVAVVMLVRTIIPIRNLYRVLKRKSLLVYYSYLNVYSFFYR